MSTPRRTLPRRLLLFAPAMLAAAATAFVAKPAHASAKKKIYECAADLLQES